MSPRARRHPREKASAQAPNGRQKPQQFSGRDATGEGASTSQAAVLGPHRMWCLFTPCPDQVISGPAGRPLNACNAGRSCGRGDAGDVVMSKTNAFSRACQNFRGLSLDWDNSIDGLVFRAGDAQHCVIPQACRAWWQSLEFQAVEKLADRKHFWPISCQFCCLPRATNTSVADLNH